MQRLLLALDLGHGTWAARRTRRPARSTAAAGIPERFDRAANADRAVLVVGAGPAGMECAIVLGKRGYGAACTWSTPTTTSAGCMRWITALPGLGELGRT